MVKSPNHNKSLALSKLQCRINDFSSEILEIVNAESKGGLYTKFVRKFLTYIPVDYRSKDKIELFGDFTHEAFDFFLEGQNTIPSLAILSPNIELKLLHNFWKNLVHRPTLLLPVKQ